MKYSLGLDIGITSVGWAVLNLDKKRIEDLGVRAFNAAEVPKTKGPLAEARRIARGTRRRLRRRAGRMDRARDLFVKYGLIEKPEITLQGDPTPWELRTKGLDELLTGEELARALYHIIKRRGFKSNRKKVKAEGEDGKALGSIEANKNILQHYRTVGEMFQCDEKFINKKKNTTDSYSLSIDRDSLENEITVICKLQRSFGSKYASEDFEKEILDIFNWQMPYAKGDDIIKMAGKCTFTGEIRAPKYSYHAERFNLLQKINNHLQVIGDGFHIDQTHRDIVAKMAYEKKKITYKQIRKELDIPEDSTFKNLRYNFKTDNPYKCEESNFIELKGYHAIKDAYSKADLWDQISDDHDTLDHIAYALTFYKTDEDIKDYILVNDIDSSLAECALSCETFAKTSNLSLTAMKKIIPFLEEGHVYSKACELAGYNHSNPNEYEKHHKLPVIEREDFTNPVVFRALTQARKVVNAVIEKYGSPYFVRIELAREIGKSVEQRGEIEKKQKENESKNRQLREDFKETFGRECNGTDLLKWLLYREQESKCAYSQQPIDTNRLFESGYTEIDHILPYSRSFDDSRTNKALVLSYENQNKLNRTPYEWFGSDVKRWNEFKAWTHEVIHDSRKRNNLLIEDYSKRQDDWMERNLNDTKYIARAFSQFLRDNLIFAEYQPDSIDAIKPNKEKKDKIRVQCVSGFITARMRNLWGLEKVREENDLHHAMDAAVIAAIEPGMIKRITDYSKFRETKQTEYIDPETGEIIEIKSNRRPKPPQPWPNFRTEIQVRLSDNPEELIKAMKLDSYSDKDDIKPVLVSRMPQRKADGAIHKDTIRSAKNYESDGISTVKKKLTQLKETDLNNLFAPETNEKLYDAIKQRMANFNFKAEAAFKEPLYKPRKDGTPGPEVKSIKLTTKQNTGIMVRQGIADNGGMVRTDVFSKIENGKLQYYLVPIYISDIMSGNLPNKAIEAYKNENMWPIMNKNYTFLFSLYSYDLIKVTHKNENKLLYYKSSHRGTGQLCCCEMNNAQNDYNFGARTVKSIEKYEMGILGNIYPVRKEKRRGLENYSDLKSGETEDT